MSKKFTPLKSGEYVENLNTPKGRRVALLSVSEDEDITVCIDGAASSYTFEPTKSLGSSYQSSIELYHSDEPIVTPALLRHVIAVLKEQLNTLEKEVDGHCRPIESN